MNKLREVVAENFSEDNNDVEMHWSGEPSQSSNVAEETTHIPYAAEEVHKKNDEVESDDRTINKQNSSIMNGNADAPVDREDGGTPTMLEIRRSVIR